VCDGTWDDSALVVAGNERVLRARLADAPFEKIGVAQETRGEDGAWPLIDFGGRAGLHQLTLVDDRFSGNSNTVVLPSYEKYDLGVILSSESGFFVQLHGDNVGDSDGITEGDPRSPTSPNGRPILGSSVKLSIGYDF